MSNMLVPQGAGQLWLPGSGFVPSHIRQAMKAIEEYDADLSLGRDEQSGDWVVLLARGPEGRPFPVLGLGTELPNPERIKQRLHMTDVRRRGPEIVASIERNNEARHKELQDKTHDGSVEAAEALDYLFRREGRHPSPRIFVPSTNRSKKD